MQNIPLEAPVGQSHTCLCRPAPQSPRGMGRGHHCHLPDLFLYSISNPVMMLLPSNRCVHLKFILRAFTSRISSSGGSGGSWGHTGRLGTQAEKAPRSREPSQQGFAPQGSRRGDGVPWTVSWIKPLSSP